MSNIEYHRETIDMMRDIADRGGRIREIAAVFLARSPASEVQVIPLLAYFRRAFCLPLREILPIREWLGSDLDDEIDAEILPKIQKAKSSWLNRSHEL